MKYPSIFNDVLGPVMRGPSSSHCAAALRIGRIARDLMNERISAVLIEFDPNGSLATTHYSQGSDMGLLGGLLGWEAHDERLPNYESEIRKAGIDVQIVITDIGATHPNTYQLTLYHEGERKTLTALSTGGGMIEVIEIDGATVSIQGDYHETLIYVQQPGGVLPWLMTQAVLDSVEWCEGNKPFILVKSRKPLEAGLLETLWSMEEVRDICEIRPVLPVLSSKQMGVPFITCEEMLAFNVDKSLQLWELALEYESKRGNIAQEEVWQKMEALVEIMQASIRQGIKGTEYPDRILGCQSGQFRQRMRSHQLVEGEVLNTIILYVSAMMEVKSSMGVIVAAPTAGACAALPGACLGAADARGLSKEEKIKGMLAAGMIGVFIAAHATFAAEVGGCQAECGSGSGMAAAAIVTLAGGTLQQALAAASIALQNSFGMVCDPVANRVEAPCLGKNIMAASNALSCANIALADYDPLIPLDEVIHAMKQVGESISHELRCTGLGGLAATPTSQKIAARLQKNAQQLPLGSFPQDFRFKSC